MKNRNEFSVGEFAAVFGVSRQTLIYYDRIGLFSPARTDPATGYRYYARRQFGEMSFIQMLAGLGVPLAAIRAQRAPIRPDRTEALLERQEAVIGEELRRLRLRESAVRLRLAQIRESRRAEGGVRLVRRAAPVPLFVSAPLDCPREDIPDRVLTDFYTAADRAGLPFGYTLSCLVAAETGRVQRLAFRLAGEDGANGALPAGDCLVLWARGRLSRNPCWTRPPAPIRRISSGALRSPRRRRDAAFFEAARAAPTPDGRIMEKMRREGSP